jgi:hypothetical protein
VTGIPLRIAEPTGRYRRSLRRYRTSQRPDGSCWCDAGTDIDMVTELERIRASADDWPHDDPRWPAECQRCNAYTFTDADRWQRNDNAVYRLPDGSEFTFWGAFGHAAPAGAMIRAAWYDDYAEMPGESWMIALPDGGEWITTQSATGGGRWTVTGTPPAITVAPSIWHNAPHGWHGWVRGGFLEPT